MDDHDREVDDEVDALIRRRVPCMIAYLHPFRVVQADGQPTWNATIDQINHRDWDYAALHEVVGGIDVGLQSPYHLAVGRDGALALPPIDGLRSTQAAVEFFNRCLAGLLLGGVYCEAINPDGLDLGSIIDWTYIRAHRYRPRQQQTGSTNTFVIARRTRWRQSLWCIHVRLGSPTPGCCGGSVHELYDTVPLVRGEYLLRGTTGLARLDWGSSLANLWIVVEQLVAELWERKVVAPTLEADPFKARRSELMDTRSWTASTRIEMLYQKGVINLDTIRALSKARKARNDLHHSGQHPSPDDARAAYQGVTGLVVVALGDERPPLFDLDLTDHALVDPFAPPQRLPGEPTHWMEIPKLPGELELELAEARVFPPG